MIEKDLERNQQIIFFIYRGDSRRNRFLPGEMVNIQGEALQPFPTFQAEVKKTQRDRDNFWV